MSDLRLARGADVVVETEVRRSRFIAVLRRAEDEPAARALVADARSAHPSARHHCSAFILDERGAGPVERSSDDGEPAGTAGIPMLEALRSSGLRDVSAVVVRYFGGVKLGTGGLVRAYGDAVRAALAVAPVVAVEHIGLWEVTLPHADAGRVEAELRARGLAVAAVSYEAGGARMTVATADGAALAGALASLTSGAAVPRPAGSVTVEHPRTP